MTAQQQTAHAVKKHTKHNTHQGYTREYINKPSPYMYSLKQQPNKYRNNQTELEQNAK
eukprot:m.155391 g.155391  ORF g.155391 m.155391 type:complete len:58 (-) comp16277_c1_seq1:3194-3367(-)